jgi:hypothetical protein
VIHLGMERKFEFYDGLSDGRMVDVRYRGVRAIVSYEYNGSNGHKYRGHLFLEHIGERWYLRMLTSEDP